MEPPHSPTSEASSPKTSGRSASTTASQDPALQRASTQLVVPVPTPVGRRPSSGSLTAYDLEPDLLISPEDRHAFNKFFLELRAPNWIVCYRDKEGCIVSWKQNPDSQFISVKGVVIVRVSPRKVATFIGTDTNFETFLKVCDKMCKYGKVIEKKDAKHSVRHAAYRFPPPLWPRDFVYAETQTQLPDGTYLNVLKSTEHPKCPPPAHRLISTIRAEVTGSGWWIERVPGDANSCVVHYQVIADPKGLLPTAVVNMVVKDQGKNVKRLKVYLEARDRAGIS